MSLNFNTTSEMLHFVRNMSANDYAKVLHTEFGYDVPAESQPWQVEFFTKYLIQGRHNGLVGVELEKYAMEKTIEVDKKFYVSLKEGAVISEPKKEYARVEVTAPVAKKDGRGRPQKHTGADGEVRFIESRKVWIGFFGGKVVANSSSEKAVKRILLAKYGV